MKDLKECLKLFAVVECEDKCEEGIGVCCYYCSQLEKCESACYAAKFFDGDNNE